MKSQIIIILLLLLTNTLHSQNITYIEGSESIDTYIGKIDKKAYFYNKDQYYFADVNIPVFSKNESGITREGELKVAPQEKIINVFIYNNRFYAITDQRSGKTMHITLNQYDQSLDLVESTPLFETGHIIKPKLIFEVKLHKDAFGIVCFKKDDLREGISLVYNLKSNKFAKTTFSHANLPQYSYSDHIFNNDLNVNIVLERVQFSASGNTSEKANALLISCNNDSEFKIQEVTAIQEEYIHKKFKLCHGQDDNSFLLGSLVFKTKGENIAGYSAALMNYGIENVSDLKFIPNDKLMNESLWLPGDYKKFSSNTFFSNSGDQHLKSIQLISGNKFLFVSESQYVNQSGVTGMSMMQSGGRANSYSPYTNGVPNVGKKDDDYWYPNYNVLGDIIMSFVDLDEMKVLWTNKTLNRVDAPRIVHYDATSAPNFLVTVSESDASIYFSLSAQLFDNQSHFNKKEGW